MYIKKQYHITTVLSWTKRYIVIFFFISVVPVILYDVVGWKWLHLPWLPIGLIGTALAFISGFKNNAAYGRLWEARKIYGGIVNTSRTLTTMVNDFITNEFSSKKYSEEEQFAIRKEIILRHVAWMTALRHSLRNPKEWESSFNNKSDKEFMKNIEVDEYQHTLEEQLEGYLSVKEKAEVLSKTNKQTACLKLQSNHFKRLKLQGLIDDFRHIEFKNSIEELFTLQGKAERIKNFPYPRQFATLNAIFVWIFIFLIPFGLINEFEHIGNTLSETNSNFITQNFVWFSIPFVMIISWIFILIERVGDTSENPFDGGMNNGVPITTMSRGIEIDIREMINDNPKDIPKAYLITNDSQM
ncbi:bestrophin family ion channel [uncultured Dokdonia sp.]|uniref:bestrophin family protein n=1 Tax=uncultured Dokdonia sp. TaxID=575653 RepID=UPI00260C8C85|nr:bestrophin family ion channel [uncultured Dokdonia sp.]